ncbi:MAG: hypothetical protein F7C34_00660 [Desulfurococcales archaeon]|nr:hypothetical protein [Desulfurococcales archaeon]
MTMNAAKIVFAALMVALMALAYAPSVPVAATDTGVTVITEVVSMNNTVYFYVNLTYLKNTFGWVGTTADIYVSNNGYGNIQPGVSDLLLVRGIYIADADYIAGYLYINNTVVNKLLGGESGYLYIKVTDGSNVAASNRFYVVTNVSEIFKANTYNLSKTSYTDTVIETNNTLNLTVDISTIAPTIDLTTQNFTILLYNNIESLELFNQTVTNTTTWKSDILDNINSSTITTTVAKINGTLKDFALGGVNAQITVQGIPVSYASFNFTFQAKKFKETFNNAINVTYNYTTGQHEFSDVPGTVTIPEITINIGSLGKTMNIFPSVELTGYTEVAGNTTEINPGDQITVKLYNFVSNTNPVHICLFVYGDGKLVQIDTSATVDTTYGNATVTVTLPEAQYGGRQFFVVAKQGDNVRGLPATNATVTSGPSIIVVHPYLEISLVKNDGTFGNFYETTNTAPGDYVLIKGHGFMNENITATIFYGGADVATLKFIADISGGDSIHVYDNGTFFSLFQIPADVDPANSPFHFSAHGTTTTNRGFSTQPFNFVLDGSVYKVFVNPAPLLLTGYGFTPDAARVDQIPATPAYPAATPWKDQLPDYAETNFTVEVIGVSFTSGSISITTDNTTYWEAASVTFTNGYFKGTVDVPVAPYGDYYVVANDSTTYYGSHSKEVYIRETARAIDPVELILNGKVEYKLQIFLGEAMNVTVLGYGWPGSATVSYIIHKTGTLLSYSETFTTAANGTFNITANISKFLEDNGPGNYTLTIYYNDTVEEIINIYYSVTPNVKVEVYTGTLKLTYPGDTVDVYAIVYLGGQLLDNDTVKPHKIEVNLTVYYYDGGNLVKLLDNAKMQYTGEPGIWHYRFAVTPDVKGDELLIKVYAEVQPKFFMIPKSDMAFTSLTVASSLEDLFNEVITEVNNGKVEIENLINDVYNNLNLKLESINGKLVVVSDTLNETYADVSALINLANAINANLTIVVDTTNSISRQIENSTEEINNNIAMVYLALEAYGEEILIKLNTTLEQLGLLITAVDNNTAIILSKLGTMEANITQLINNLNATLTGLIENKTGALIAQIKTSEGNITATINAVYEMLAYNLSVAKEEVLESIANLSANVTSFGMRLCNRLSMFQNETMTKLDAISMLINESKSQIISAVGTQAASVKGLINTKAEDIEGYIDSLNKTFTAKLGELYNETKSLNTTLTNLVSTNTKQILNAIDNLNNTLSQKLDKATKDLSQKIEESNNAVKGRVTTMTSVGIVVLLAAIVAMSVISRGRTPP